MLERTDGLLINFRDDLSKGVTEIQTYTPKLGISVKKVFNASDLELVFARSPELLNPNKTWQRHAFLGERLKCTELAITLSEESVNPLVLIERDSTFKVPMGNMSASERERVHREAVGVDCRRTEMIDALEKKRVEQTQAHLRTSREFHASRKTETALLLEEAVRRTQGEAELRHAKTNEEELKRTQLNVLRKSRQEEKAFERSIRDEEFTKHVFDTKRALEGQRAENVRSWKEKREETIRKSKEEQAAFYESMKQLEEKRKFEYNQKQLRWRTKESERLTERSTKIAAIARNKIVISEKRKARAFDLFSSQPIPA